MIRKLKITNYHSHRDTVLEFAPGVNIITGNSDSGKTSILRALRWLLWNKPTGDSMRSWWGGETEVKIETEEGYIITRSKDKENLYKLGETEFRAFKTDVPEEVQKVLNMNDINLQQQLDSPFLISSTPGEVATHFNHIAHLDEIDSSTSQINSWLLAIDRQIKTDTITIEENQEKIQDYDYLEKFEIELEVLEAQEHFMLTEIKNKNTLVSTIESLEKVEEDILKASSLLVFEESVDELLELIGKRDVREKESYWLKDHIEDIEELEKQITKQDKLIELDEAVNELIQSYKRREKLTKERDSLSTQIARMLEVNTHIEMEQDIITKREKKFEDGMGDTCPLCETDLK